MKPKSDPRSTARSQRALIGDNSQRLLSDFIDLKHPLVLLADRLEWESFEPHWSARFSNASGPHAASSRLVAGLLMLKHMHALSDENLIAQWVCNPYYQYFCGEIHFQHRPPADPTTLGRWRKRLGEEGLEYLLSTVLQSALSIGAVERRSLAHVCIDSTVMEKNITHPTDSGLLLKILQSMVAFMQQHALSVRQSYARQGPRLAQQIARYAQAKQYKRMRKTLRKLMTRVQRVQRELQRQLQQLNVFYRAEAEQLLEQAARLLAQSDNPKQKNKLYSLHEPEVDCISKGKAAKRYEFGVKVGLVTTQAEGFIIGARSYPENPYDGHTLDDMLQQASTISDTSIKDAVVDLGYRGRHQSDVKIIHRGKKLSRREKQKLRRRSAIEATIGHMKNDGLLDLCHLKGTLGDALHALLCAIGHNMRLLLNFVRKQLAKGLFTPEIGVFLRWLLQVLALKAAPTPIIT